LVAVEIGFPQEAEFPARMITPQWASTARPTRASDAHKNSVGRLLILAGKPGMAGAAVMAGRAALRAGVGLLRIASPVENREILQSTLPEAIFVDGTSPDALLQAQTESDAVLAGPGMGSHEAAVTALGQLCGSDSRVPLVLDADALNMIAQAPVPGLSEITAERAVLVTPHLGEMERLSGVARHELTERRIEAAQDFSAQSGSTLLLKGLPSMVVEPGGRVWVDSVATSDLATAGMGDVLAGAAGAFAAQGVAGAESGCLALYYTGRAALLAGTGVSLTPSDVIERLPTALAEAGSGYSDLDFPFVIFDQDPAR
jgi:NAD(P)H-hydrate epimerase